MRWISVKERLPDEEFLWLAVWVQVRGIEYWCEAEYSPGEEFRGQFCGYDSETGEYYPLDGVTHWMEIEPPMKEETDEKTAQNSLLSGCVFLSVLHVYGLFYTDGEHRNSERSCRVEHDCLRPRSACVCIGFR